MPFSHCSSPRPRLHARASSLPQISRHAVLFTTEFVRFMQHTAPGLPAAAQSSASLHWNTVLEAHVEADVPALSGGARRIPRTQLGQEVWSPALRFLVGSVGVSAIGAGLRRGGPIGIVTALFGAGAVARSVTNEPPRRLYGLVDRHRAEGAQLPESSSKADEPLRISSSTASASPDSRISIQ